MFFGQTEAGRQVAGRRKRIVDEIWGQAKGLKSKVSQRDHQKLDQYLDSIADLETKLQKAMHPVEKGWNPKIDPAAARPQQSGIPTDHREHMRLMLDILLLALQTDSTRVATMVMGHSISRIVYDFADASIKRNHHDLSHHRNDPEKIESYNRVTEWFAGQAAYLLERMQDIDEGDGSLLDHSLVLYGSGMKDGNVHESINIPVALFGGANGALKPGRLIDTPKNAQLAQLHLGILQTLGVKAAEFNGVANKPIAL